MNSFKLLGIRFSYRKERNIPTNFKLYASDDMGTLNDHIWYIVYNKYLDQFIVKNLKYVTILSNRKPIRLRLNGSDINIKYLSTDKDFVQSKADLYNSYNKTLA